MNMAGESYRFKSLKLSLTRFNVLKTLHIFPLNDCLLLLMVKSLP